jgi:hypothetical protein
MKSFEAKRKKLVYTDILMATPEDIWPLCCPVGEEKWIFGWDNNTYDLIYSESGVNEEGCIFKTNYGETPSLWTTVKHNKENYEMEFSVVIFDVAVNKYQITLSRNEDNTTTIKSEYTFTAISEKGNQFIENLEKILGKSNADRRKALKYYAINGKKIASLDD